MIFLLYIVDNAAQLPPLGADQKLKLKQLTVLTLAEAAKVFVLNGKLEIYISVM